MSIPQRPHLRDPQFAGKQPGVGSTRQPQHPVSDSAEVLCYADLMVVRVGYAVSGVVCCVLALGCGSSTSTYVPDAGSVGGSAGSGSGDTGGSGSGDTGGRGGGVTDGGEGGEPGAGGATRGGTSNGGNGGDGGSAGATAGSSGAGGEAGQPSTCGNAMLDPGEDCDERPSEGAATCCTSACRFAAAGVVCRVGSGDMCDPSETCDGTSARCPPNLLSQADVVCRVDSDGPAGCDRAEVCPGTTGMACPDDVAEPDGTPCTGNGTSTCSGADTCQNGVCLNNDLPISTPCGGALSQPTCNPDACDGSGNCVDTPALANGAPCTDNAGTSCCGGVCAAGSSGPDSCCVPTPGPQVIDIIESPIAGHTMDMAWLTLATNLGHSASIRAQSVLENIANLANTNILVVSSGTAQLTPTHVATIQAFLTSGRGVYLQGEYLTTYTANQAFAQIVNATGGTFTWDDTAVGAREPVTPRGCWASSPETVAPLNYFWYGATGSGSVETILSDELATALGWAWCVPGSVHGLIVHTTDQDFIRTNTAEDLAFMRNVIARLAAASSCG